MEAVKDVKESTTIELGALLDDGDGAVVTLVAADTRLVAHRAVLANRSPVFMAMFGHNTLESSSGQVVIPDIEGPVLRQLLAYLYTLQAPQLSGMAPQLLAAADKYCLLALKAQCEQQLVAQLAVENAAAAAVLAVRHSCSSLRQAALTFIKAHGFQVMATQGWADAMREQTADLIEVSCMLYDPPPETRLPAATGGTTTDSTSASASASTAIAAAAPCQPHSRTPVVAVLSTSPPDAAAVSRLRSLSAEERNRRLREAAKEGKVAELRALLAAGADVAVKDKWDRTALHWAAFKGQVQAASCLLEAGAQVGARSIEQNTPLHYAASEGHAAVVRLLLAWSAEVNARDRQGRTPLHDAAQSGHAATVTVLLEAGANRGARTDEGETPLDIARKYNHLQLIEMLSPQT